MSSEFPNAAAVAFVNVSREYKKPELKESFARSFLGYFLWGEAGEKLAAHVIGRNSSPTVLRCIEELRNRENECENRCDITLDVTSGTSTKRIVLELKVGAAPDAQQLIRYARLEDVDFVVLVAPELSRSSAKAAVAGANDAIDGSRKIVSFLTWDELADITGTPVDQLVECLLLPIAPRELPAGWWRSSWARNFVESAARATKVLRIFNEYSPGTGALNVSTHKGNQRFWISRQWRPQPSRYIILEFDPTDPAGAVCLDDRGAYDGRYYLDGAEESDICDLLDRLRKSGNRTSSSRRLKWTIDEKPAFGREDYPKVAALWYLLFELQQIELDATSLKGTRERWKLDNSGVKVGRFELDFERLNNNQFPILFNRKPLSAHSSMKKLLVQARCVANDT